MNYQTEFPTLRSRHISVFTHVDNDGLACGAIIRQFSNNAFVNMINYNKDYDFSSIPPGNVVVVCDFSFPLEDMQQLQQRHDLIWIDHHPVIDDYAKEGFSCAGLRRQDCSAAKLTWEYFFPEKPVPRAIEYISDYDIWTHAHKESLPFHYALGMLKLRPSSYNDKQWHQLLTDDLFVDNLVANGNTIQSFVDSYNSAICKDMAFEVDFHGHKAIVCNVKTTNSLLFASLKEKNYDIQILFGWFGSIGKFRVSIFSDKVSMKEIANQYGGGGHAGAAGFAVIDLPFSTPVPEDKPSLPKALKELHLSYTDSPIVSQYLSLGYGPLVWSHQYPGEYTTVTNDKYTAVYLNHPTCSAEALFVTGLNWKYQLGIAYALLNTGWWLTRFIPLSPMLSLPELAGDLKKKIESDVVLKDSIVEYVGNEIWVVSIKKF